jgi:poly-D-alanine transfer protein DltD
MEKIKIERTIAEFIQEHNLLVKAGTIHLGWVNGWTEKDRAIRNALFEYAVKDTYSKEGPASWQITSFMIEKDGEQYIVIYELDSGD